MFKSPRRNRFAHAAHAVSTSIPSPAWTNCAYKSRLLEQDYDAFQRRLDDSRIIAPIVEAAETGDLEAVKRATVHERTRQHLNAMGGSFTNLFWVTNEELGELVELLRQRLDHQQDRLHRLEEMIGLLAAPPGLSAATGLRLLKSRSAKTRTHTPSMAAVSSPAPGPAA
jgi:hypothetical protein